MKDYKSVIFQLGRHELVLGPMTQAGSDRVELNWWVGGEV
jgi:hypothetical protein